MNSNNTIKVGDERFKAWLRTLDPVTRVKRMSDIAQNLATMNLRPSDIKAALAQLSQRCQVMIVRLTEKEIKRHTRMKPHKTQNSKSASLPLQLVETPTNVGLSNDKISSAVIGKHTSLKLFNCNPQDKNSSETLIHYTKKLKSSKSTKSSKCMSKPEKQKKKEKLMRELFGDEPSEHGTSDLLPNHNSSKEKNSNVVNNYFPTVVNVNIYNTNPSKDIESSTSSSAKQIISEKSLFNPCNESQKRLRIDESIANETSLKEDNGQMEVVEEETKQGSHLVTTHNLKRKNSSLSHSKKKTSSSKKKFKKYCKKSPRNVLQVVSANNTDEDPSIKELWSIFGMEAPSERTAKFLSGSITLSNSDAKKSLNSNDEAISNGLLACPQEKTVVNTVPDCTEETEVPFLKICETFSLAEVNNEDKGESREDEESNKEEENNMITSNGKSLITTQEKESEKAMEVKSKIGSIRVKNIGLLIDPKLQQSTQSDAPHSADMPDPNSLTSNSEKDLESSLEERFFATYSYYFDELVEAKIPKLGELLHLALADAVRLGKRIKRAEQLSSEDIIKEEKKRLEKDFDEMIKIRTAEFTPLCDVIVKRFDPKSKITLFIALFYRIIKNAGTIDAINETRVLLAKRVISLMFKKYQYTDEEISNTVEASNEEFNAQLNEIAKLVAKCSRISDSKPSSNVKTSVQGCGSYSGNSIKLMTTTNESSVRNDNSNYVAYRISEETFQEILSGRKESHVNNGHRTSEGSLNNTQHSVPLTKFRDSSRGPGNPILSGATQLSSHQQSTTINTDRQLIDQLKSELALRKRKKINVVKDCNISINKNNYNCTPRSQQTKKTNSRGVAQSKTNPNTSVLNKLHPDGSNLTTSQKLTAGSAVTNTSNVPQVSLTVIKLPLTTEPTPQSTNASSKQSTVVKPTPNQPRFNLIPAPPKVGYPRKSTTLNNFSFPRLPLNPSVNRMPNTASDQNELRLRNMAKANSSELSNNSVSNHQLSAKSAHIQPVLCNATSTSASLQPITTTRYASSTIASSSSKTGLFEKAVIVPQQDGRTSTNSSSTITSGRQSSTITSAHQSSSVPPTPNRPRLSITTNNQQQMSINNFANVNQVSTAASVPIQSRLSYSTTPNAFRVISGNFIGRQSGLGQSYLVTPVIMGSSQLQERSREDNTTKNTYRETGSNTPINVSPTQASNNSNSTSSNPDVTFPTSEVERRREENSASNKYGETRTNINLNISTQASNNSSTTLSSPEVTSPTSEVNLPSSSHCHPFIARRPISGKMKMLFGNSSNS